MIALRLRVVGDAMRASRRCDMTVGEIAARAGVGETTARNALRAAARLGLLTIEERRRRGQPNLSNIVRIVSREWLAWLDRGGGCKKPEVTDNPIFKRQNTPAPAQWVAASGGGSARPYEVPVNAGKSSDLSQKASIDQSIHDTSTGGKAINKATVIQAEVPLNFGHP